MVARVVRPQVLGMPVGAGDVVDVVVVGIGSRRARARGLDVSRRRERGRGLTQIERKRVCGCVFVLYERIHWFSKKAGSLNKFTPL